MKEALKLALEALEKHAELGLLAGATITAIKEVLAQPAQEPVAYFNPQVKGGFYWARPTKITAPVTVSVEPMPLYTTPPQRTWVRLTHTDIDQGLLRSDYALKTAEAWRAGVVFAMTKLKEKNT